VSADDTIRPALAACHIAERARCLDEPDQSDRWADAYRACLRAQYPWEASWAAYQRSRALLRERGHRGEAAQALRESQDIATSLGAEPLLTRIAFIATQARVVLAAGPRAHDEDGAPGDLSGVGLTRREREVLAHVVAGRTYAEIGRRLFITEKTVSVHVSHIMAKTGTGSRVELAALATRPRPQDPG
jgi:DNA-binding CsgD family transcriptional regulator